MDEVRPTAVLCGDLNMLVSPDEADLTFYSRHCRRRRVIASPVAQPEAALRDLLDLGAELPPRPVLFYGNDATLLLVSRNRDALARYYDFLLPDLLEALVDKARFADLARARGLPVPRALTSAQAPTPEDALRRLTLPCILKPQVHIGWSTSQAVRRLGRPCKALRADTRDELRAAYEALRSFCSGFLIQEYVPGDDRCLYTFHAYLDRAGRPLGHYVGRKIRTYPPDTGVSTFLELCDDPEITSLGLDVLQRLCFKGIVKIDFKRDARTGRPLVLELNPRFNLWHYLGAAGGINLPLIALRDLSGRAGHAAPTTPGYRAGIRWLALDDDLRALLRDYRPGGKLSLPGWLRSLAGKNVYNVFSLSDPVPAIVSTGRYLRALSRRLHLDLQGQAAP
jgi:predicted ATP-grasp superfamily ATP-dependent carboligase